MSSSNVLYVSIPARVSVSVGGRSVAAKRAAELGLTVDRAETNEPLRLALNPQKPTSLWPLSALKRIHRNQLEQGRATIELVPPGRANDMHVLFIADAKPDELRDMLLTIEESLVRARRQSRPLNTEAAEAELSKRFSSQLKKQQKALRDLAEQNGPRPQKGHECVMIVVEAPELTYTAVAKRALAALGAKVGARSSGRNESDVRGVFFATAQDASGKPMVRLSARACVHEPLNGAGAVYLELDTTEGIKAADVQRVVLEDFGHTAFCGNSKTARYSSWSLPHRVVSEKLGAGLVLHIRSGFVRGVNLPFATRFEMRRVGAEHTSLPLGKCDLRYFEEGTAAAAPLVTLLRMNQEACTTWLKEHPTQSLSACAPTLVSRVEVFCKRVAAAGHGLQQPRLLVAGWLPQVTAAPFVRKGYQFKSEPDHSLGVHSLVDEPKKRKRVDVEQADVEAETPRAKPSAATTPVTGEADRRHDGADASDASPPPPPPPPPLDEPAAVDAEELGELAHIGQVNRPVAAAADGVPEDDDADVAAILAEAGLEGVSAPTKLSAVAGPPIDMEAPDASHSYTKFDDESDDEVAAAILAEAAE